MVLKIHHPAIAFGSFSASNLEFIKHLDYEGKVVQDSVSYVFFKRKNRFWQIPWGTHRYIKSNDPDIVLIQGFIFPIQLILLRLFLKRSVKIIVQHHGEQPFRGIKKQLQKIAGKCTDAWLFTSTGNAKKWIDQKIIPQSGSCYELPEASTTFKRLSDRIRIKNEMGMVGDQNFLWVGRLNENKDPLTVINGFAHFATSHPEAVLHMVFQENTLLPDIMKLINHLNIEKQVLLVGAKPHDELENWFNAADFYISGSRQEGSGYALIEAIACGCIPVVTDIPPFRKLTANGSLGFLYPPGHTNSLYEQLKNAIMVDRKYWAEQLETHFHKKLSFKNIARELDRICLKILYSN